jgi:membrane protease YdiL (CAAX protease family)
VTGLDYLLLVALLLFLPAQALWVTLRPTCRPTRRMAQRLVRSMITVAALLALLFAIWWLERRSLAALGLDVPVSTTGLIGIAASILVIGSLAAATLVKGRGGPPDKPPPGAELLPATAGESCLFLLFSLVAGFGWELLYRGYLLWALTPLTGTPAAVVLAAAAYGFAHGARDVRSLIGALVTSFLFTTAYAMTGSLWWLIILHAGLPMIGLLAARLSRPGART